MTIPLLLATNTRPSGAKRITVGLPSPLQTVVSPNPAGSVPASAGATGASNGSACAAAGRLSSTATTTSASRLIRVNLVHGGGTTIERPPTALAGPRRAHTVRRVRRPSAAMLIALLALFVALGGPAQARKLNNGSDIRKGTVLSAQIKDGSLTERDLSSSTRTHSRSAIRRPAARARAASCSRSAT